MQKKRIHSMKWKENKIKHLSPPVLLPQLATISDLLLHKHLVAWTLDSDQCQWDLESNPKFWSSLVWTIFPNQWWASTHKWGQWEEISLTNQSEVISLNNPSNLLETTDTCVFFVNIIYLYEIIFKEIKSISMIIYLESMHCRIDLPLR